MSKAVRFDTLSYVEELESAGIKSDQAKAHAKALEKALEFNVPTKADTDANLIRLENKLDTKFIELENKIDLLDKKIDAKFDLLDKKIDSKVDLLDKKIDVKVENAKNTILWWIVTTFLIQVALFTLSKFIH